MNGREEKCVQSFGKKPGINHLEDVGVDGRIYKIDFQEIR
jgi:hypothetical protein